MKRMLMMFVAFAPAALLAQLPPAISSTAVQRGDSPLVAAAKRAVAARQQGEHATWVIDDSMVTHRLLPAAETAASLTPASTAGRNEAPSTFSSAHAPGLTPEQAQARKVALRRELERMVDESNKPYGDDVEEDLIDKHLNDIAGQLASSQPPRQ